MGDQGNSSRAFYQRKSALNSIFSCVTMYVAVMRLNPKLQTHVNYKHIKKVLPIPRGPCKTLFVKPMLTSMQRGTPSFSLVFLRHSYCSSLNMHIPFGIICALFLPFARVRFPVENSGKVGQVETKK